MSRKTRKASSSHRANEVIAREVNEDHDGMVAKGYELTRASRVWLRSDQCATVRLVYRHPKPDIQKLLWQSVVLTVRLRAAA